MQFPFPSGSAEPALELEQEAAARGMTLREIWAALYRSRLWIAIIMAVCIALAIIATLLATRLYQAQALVEVRSEAEKVLGTEADREGAANTRDTDRFLQTQLDIIRSRAVADAVAEQLNLYRGTSFLDAMKVEEDLSKTEPLSPREAHREIVLQTLIDHLNARFTGDTRIAVIGFTSPDPRLSTQVANGYADAFIRKNLDRKFDSSSYALDFLRNQLREAQERLEQSEREALDYARRTRIVDASNAAGGSSASGDRGRPQSLVTAQLVQLNQSYSDAVNDRIEAQQKWERVSGQPLLSVTEVLGNGAIQDLFQRRATATAEYQEQLKTRQPDYPAVQQARAEIDEYNRQINVLARGIRDSIHNQFQIAAAREQQLSGKIDTLKANTLTEQNQGIELSILRREADTNRQQYEALLRRFNELNAESGVQTNNLSIVDRAQIPLRPSWPKLPLNLALAVLLGGAISGLFVLIREQLFHTLRTPDEVSSRLRLPLLGVVPASENIATELSDNKSSLSDAYSSVRTSLSLASDNGLPRSVMFTSTQQGEGKSTACHALALSLARLGKRVLIIDADLRRPNAHKLFDLPNRAGFSNILAGQAGEEAIQQTRVPQVDVLPAGEIPPNPTELVSSGQLPALLARLGERYDVLLIDSAPVLGLADAIILSGRAEATVFVIEAGRNPVRAVQGALTRLGQSGGHVVGAVLTKYDPGSLGYGYGDSYSYRYAYGSTTDSDV